MNISLKLFCILALPTLMLLTACDDASYEGYSPSMSANDFISIEVENSTFGASSNLESKIIVSSNTSWRFEGYDATWLTITPSSGSGDATVIVKASVNTKGPSRTTTATLLTTSSTYRNTKSLVFTQNEYPDPLGLCRDINHPHKIDMGDGLEWSCCNVGAKSPIEYGDYFAWGETKPKSNYGWSTYIYCNGSSDTMTKYCNSSDYGIVDNKTQLDLSDDAARVNWGSAWRMPTIIELRKLSRNCTWIQTTINGVNGYKVTASNGNVLFFPLGGAPYSTTLFNDMGLYWSSSLMTDHSDMAYILCNDGTDGGLDRDMSLSVRPVIGEN